MSMDPQKVALAQSRVTEIRQAKTEIENHKKQLATKSVEQAQEESEAALDKILGMPEEAVHADDWRDLTTLQENLGERTRITKELREKEKEYERLRNSFLGRSTES